MTYPNQPGTPGYPQQYPAQPQYAPQPQPQQYQAPWVPAGYPAQPQYPQQGFAPQPQTAPAPPVLARGTLEDFIDQPTGGGGAATSKFFTPQRPVGSWLQLRVARDLNHSDVRQQTDKFGAPLTFKSSGKPKLVLIVPCQVLASNDGSHQTIYPEGQVTVWLKGVPFDAFKQAMRAAGISNPDKAVVLGQWEGASFYMVGAGTKQFGQGNPANMFDFQYTPNGRELAEEGAQAAPAAPVPPTAPAASSQVSAPPTAPAQPQQNLPASPPAPGYRGSPLPDMTQQYQQQAAQLAAQAGIPQAPVTMQAPVAPPQPQFASTDPAGYQAAGSPPFGTPPSPGIPQGPPQVPGLPGVPQPGMPVPPPAPVQPSGAAAMPSYPPAPGGQEQLAAPALSAEQAALLQKLQGGQG